MTRDIEERLNDVFGIAVTVDRIALNMPQVEEHDPPPNPAKVTDSRAPDYIRRYGRSSWELDALEPAVLDGLILEAIDRYLEDGDRYEARVNQLAHERRMLRRFASHYYELEQEAQRLERDEES